MTNKLPKRVADAIAAYRAAAESARENAKRAEDRAAELQAELERAKAELDAAVDAAILEPSQANARKEADLRKKVAELTLELGGAADRKRRAYTLGRQRERELALAAIKAGREEAERYYYERHDEALQRIADAKYAYLTACVDYYRLRRHASDIFQQAVSQTNPNYVQSSADAPNLRTESLFYRGGNRQIYGINELEVDRAVKHGQIRKTSCPKGKEIE